MGTVDNLIIWACVDCERIFALDSDVTADDETECPYCGSERVGAITEGVS